MHPHPCTVKYQVNKILHLYTVTYTGGLCDGGGLPMHCTLAGRGGAAMGGGILETFIGDMVVWTGG